jgi:hypothetical protein
MSAFQDLNRPIRVLMLLLFAAATPGNAFDLPANAAPVSDEAPQIFFAPSPALLILIDGDPVYQKVEGTDLERIINTNVLIVRDHAHIYYLKIRDGWMEAYALTGLWSVSGVAPASKEALDREANAKAVDLLIDGDGSQGHASSLAEQPPAIYVSTELAVLIITDGPEQYRNVQGTSLEYLANTTATVFKEPTDHELYVLVSGRWLRSWTTDGPWQYLPSDQLPADIAKIWHERTEGGGSVEHESSR